MVVGFLCLFCSASTNASSRQVKPPFTVSDDIRLLVPAGSSGSDEELVFSPDGKYFVIETERGRLDLNRPEDSLRFYRCRDIVAFLKSGNGSQVPSPLWVVNRSTYKEGPIIQRWSWLPDSSGMAFLERASANSYRLVLADLRNKTTEPLTSKSEAVDQFHVRDRQHYVYTASDPAKWKKVHTSDVPEIIGTSLTLNQLLLPDDPVTIEMSSPPGALWAFVDGNRFEVKHDGEAILPDPQGLAPLGLVLSPDGNSVIASLPVPEIPSSWETLYPPPFASDPSRIRAGHGSAHQWVWIDLRTGSIQPLTDAPINPQGSWGWMLGGPSWSSDGQAVLLPGTFVESKDNVPSRPCIAVVDIASNTRTCVEMLKGRTETGVEDGFHHIQEVRFLAGDKHRILVRFRTNEDIYSFGTTEYELTAGGTWHMLRQSKSDLETRRDGLDVGVEEGLNEPPQIVATYKKESRVIWDPNPQLKNVQLGQSSVYKWKDKEGREWKGGLFKPNGYKPGQRYPLVIQTHGFTESKFIPSGIYPTAFAARALASVGILVLQVSESSCPSGTPEEAPCSVSGYESGTEQLIADGLVDRQRIGIIGFSRTCYSVMEMLTTSALHLKAASVTDGIMADYLQYMKTVDQADNRLAKVYDSMIGSPPFGEGLQQWLRRSPGFNLDKITAPLLVVAEGPSSLLFMWGPYAGLRYLNKPVDLIVLNTHEHVLTNPAVRLASQGGSVDWFRFWLQGYEDLNPEKSGQYVRWRELKKLCQKGDGS
jgi:hypothetical protein